MTLRLVVRGFETAEGPGTVSKVLSWHVMLDVVGLRGIAGRWCWRYHAKMRWPNLDGMDEAPATANREAVKKVAAAARMSIAVAMRWCDAEM